MDTTLLLLPLALLLYVFTVEFLAKFFFNRPPTPFPALPILGHLYLFFFFFRPSLPIHRVLSIVSRRHGPLLFFHLGSRPALLVSSPEFARQCFTQNDVVFANRPNYLLNGKHFGYNFTSLAWAPYGPHWRNLRAISTLHFLSAHKLAMLSHIRAEEARCMIFKLFEKSSEHVDMRKVLFEYMYNVVTGMIKGKARGVEAEGEAEDFQEIVGGMSSVTTGANAVDFVPILRWVGVGEVVERKMRSVQEKRDKFVENLLQQWRGENNGSCAKNLVDVLQGLQSEEPEMYTEETIRNLLLV